MQNVNFRCGHCGQTLAVNPQHLGMQVRCPHCQQVVTAPTTLAGQPAPPPAPVPLPPPPPAPLPQTLDTTFAFTPPVQPEEHESIFTDATQTDDLFGQSAAKIEMPREAGAPPAPGPLLPNLELESSNPSPPTQAEGTIPYFPSAALQAVDPGNVTVPQAPMPVLSDAQQPWMSPSGLETGPVESDALTDAATEAILARPRSRSGWHIALFIIPLISYAALATVAAAILWFRLQDRLPHPLKEMPDIKGDHPTRKADGKLSIPRPKAGQPLPAELVVRLGKTIQLGDLEIEPLKIVRGSIEIAEDKPDGPAQQYERALMLYLRFKNLSQDLSFYPMDRFFTRSWVPGGSKVGHLNGHWMPPDEEPYTMLELGTKRFYGGPAAYRPPVKGKALGDFYPNEFIKGQDFDKILEPGQSMDTFICTDPQDRQLTAALSKYDGDLRWRVQVRRGSVTIEGRRIPCTAVIGVDFSTSEIKDN